MARFGIIIYLLCILRCCIVNVATSNNKMKPIKIPALGRSFSIGSLYNRHDDAIIPGVKLWSSKELSDYTQTKSYETFSKIAAGQTLEEKFSTFNIKSELKLSFLAGLIQVRGSAAYLDDRVSRSNIARVTLEYKSETFHREINPSVLSNITYPEVLKKVTSATDVVVGIQYGAGAYFVFEKDVEESENKKSVEGGLSLSVKSIPFLSIEGSGSVKLNESDRKNVRSFRCTFHGDFVLSHHPTSYEDAVNVYRKLPSLLGKDYENSVPITIWLLPISKLPTSKGEILVNEVKSSLVSETTKVFENLEMDMRRCEDILNTKIVYYHKRIEDHVNEFKNLIKQYILRLQQKVMKLLPEIRKGLEDTSKLANLLSVHEASLFSSQKINEWLLRKEEEITVLKGTQSLPNKCRDDSEVTRQLLNQKRYTLSLTFKVSDYQDSYIASMKAHLNSEQNSLSPSFPDKWWDPTKEYVPQLQNKMYILREFFDLEQKRAHTSNINFISRDAQESNKDKQGIFLELFDEARLMSKDFALPSPIDNVMTLNVTHDSIVLNWTCCKRSPTVKHYNSTELFSRFDITYSRLLNGTSNDVCSVNRCNNLTAFSHPVKIRNLKANSVYRIQVSVYTKIGKTSISDVLTTHTKDCPPGMYHKDFHTCVFCDEGQYNDKYGSNSCHKCPMGTYIDAKGGYDIRSCKKCPSGTYSSTDGCGNQNCCQECPPGTYNNNYGSTAITNCIRCPSGTFNPLPRQISSLACRKCSAGTYGTNTGASACISCPAGYFTNYAGAVNQHECLKTKVFDSMQKSLTQLSTQVTQMLNDISQLNNSMTDLQAPYVYIQISKTWDEAYFACKGLGMRLAVVKSFVQVSEELAKRGISYAWVGAKKTSGNWKWSNDVEVNGTQIENDTNDSGCLEVYRSGKVASYRCSGSQSYICEKL